MGVAEKILGQLQPGVTAAAIYTLPSGSRAVIKTIVICNTGIAGTYRVFVDNAGSTYTAAKALFYDAAIAANETIVSSIFIGMSIPGGTVGVRGSTSDITFTLSGAEVV